MAIVAIIALALALATFACDNGNDNNGNKDNPIQDRTGTVALDRGLGSITVQVMGMTTKAEWNDIANKVATSVNNLLEADITEWGEQTVIDAYGELFARGVVYIVEPNPVGYNSYKTTGDGKTVYIALSEVDTKTPGYMLNPLYQNQIAIDGRIVFQESTITAFNKTVTVYGDTTIPPTDFETAVKNLQATLTAMDEDTNLDTNVRNGLTYFLLWSIRIVYGNDVPRGGGGGLYVGVEYLKSNDEQTIKGDLTNLTNGTTYGMH